MLDRPYLIAAILLLLVWCSCKMNSNEAVESDFKINKPERIYSIEIYHRGQLDQTLKKINQEWYLNQKYKVRPDAIDNILRIVPYIAISYYPPRASWESMIHAIGTEGVRLRFKDETGQLIKSYSIGGTTNDERGTYAILEGSIKPYVIHVPGFEGSLANRFNMSDHEWRDRMIFHENIDKLKSIKITYPSEPSVGFELKQKAGQWILFDLVQNEIKSSEGVLKSYLDNFTGIGAEGIENDFDRIPEVLSSQPHAIFELRHLNDSIRTIKFFPVRLEGQSAVDRFYVYDGHDFFLAQLRILQKLFRSIDSF